MLPWAANGQVTVTGYLAEAGGYTGINFALSNSATGSSGGQGSLGATSCQRGSQAFTSCTVTYSAPASISATGATYVVATVGNSASKDAAEVLLNTAGVPSNPASHQAQSASTDSAGQLGRQQQRLRHPGQPDCRLLQRHAGLAGSGLKQSPVPAQQ